MKKLLIIILILLCFKIGYTATESEIYKILVKIERQLDILIEETALVQRLLADIRNETRRELP